MKRIWTCRRTFIAVLGILAACILGIHNHVDTSIAIAGICASLAGANAYSETKKV